MQEKSERYFNDGLNYLSKGKYPEAIRCFNEVLKTSPRDYDALFHQAKTYFAWSRKVEILPPPKEVNLLDEALKWITKCTLDYLEFKEAWELKNEILNALGRSGEAVDCEEIAQDIWLRGKQKMQSRTQEVGLSDLFLEKKVYPLQDTRKTKKVRDANEGRRLFEIVGVVGGKPVFKKI